MWIDLTRPRTPSPRVRTRGGRGARGVALAALLLTAVRPLSLVVHEHRGGDHAHVHLFAESTSDDLAHEILDHFVHHHHHDEHHHHHGAAHHHRARAAADRYDERVPPALAGGAVLQSSPAHAQLHWHGQHPLAIGAPSLTCLLAVLPVAAIRPTTRPDPRVARHTDADRARGPPFSRFVPKTGLS